jgi:hypothetical protein
MALLPFLGLGAEAAEARDLFQLGALALTALTLVPPLGYRTLRHQGVPELEPRRSPYPEALRRLVARLLGIEAPFDTLAAGVRALDTLAFDLDPGFECGAVARAVYLRAAYPEAFRLQSREWRREARVDWSAFLAVERILRQQGYASVEENIRRGLVAGVTG